jgi:type IV pilus assembly protein PilC
MNDTATIYAWEGINRKGRRVSGHTVGQNLALIKAQLRQQGICPGRVRKKTTRVPRFAPPIKPADIALFTRQLATLLKAGIPLLQAFDIIREGFDSRPMRELVRALKQEIAAGNNLAMTCIATWWPPVSRPARWKPCWNESPCTWKKASSSRHASRRP